MLRLPKMWFKRRHDGSHGSQPFTGEAAGAVGRMLDLGIFAFLALSTLVGVIAQRLVRKSVLSVPWTIICQTSRFKCQAMKGFEEMEAEVSQRRAVEVLHRLLRPNCVFLR